MLQPLDEVEDKFAALEDPEQHPPPPALDPTPSVPTSTASVSTPTPTATPTPALSVGATSGTDDAGGDSDHLPHKKRQKKMPSGSNAVSKELSAEQKAIVKMNVTRDATTDGFVKCCYCEKEISSKNVDRWASHLRGCLKAPEEVKVQIQPFRPAQTALPGATATATAPSATASVPGGLSMASPSVGLQAAAGLGTALAPSGHVATGAMVGISSVLTSGYNEVFKVHVSKDYMKFNAAHFIAYKGFRERLHGHNYRVAVTITGTVGSDGYVVDFGEIKKIARVICKDLNESFLVPMNSDALTISFDGTNVHIVTEDNAKFSFPKSDCSLLPIIHSSAEELAIYISNQIIEAFTVVALLERNVRKLEVSISEAHMQMASYERSILPSA